jgi:tetrathionate reductase subunit B
MDRREFLKVAGGTALLGGATAYGVNLLVPYKEGLTGSGGPRTGLKQGMVIDLNACATKPGCTACLDACREENNVAFHGDKRWDIHWIRKVKIKRMDTAGAKEKPALLLCNHCEHPPCAQVCPVQATYQRSDGIVIVDHHRCIGCRYCMIACPYSVRFFNYKDNESWPNKERPRRSHGVAEGCTLCAHKLDVNEPPACVKACHDVGADAIAVGDLNDPNSEISKRIASGGASRLREDLGTEPKVYYLGL